MKRFIVLLIVCLLVFSGCGSTAQSESTAGTHGGAVAGGENTTAANTENIEDQIKVELVKLPEDGYKAVCALIHNNSNVTVGELRIQILFYDASGNIVGEDSDGHDVVLPGSTVVSYVSDFDVPNNYNHMDYKLTVDAGANSGYKNHAANVKVESNVGDDCVIVQITNNAGVDIDEVEYVVVFYKNDKIVYMSSAEDVRDISAGETVIEKCDCRKVDFDKYEIYLNQAHTFGL